MNAGVPLVGPLRVVVCGPVAAEGTQLAAEVLGRLGPLVEWRHAGHELPAEADPATDVVLLLQSRPGEWLAGRVAAWRRAAPCARWIVIGGPWCGGEARSGRPLAGAVRLDGLQAARELPRLLASLARGARHPATLPPTASAEEQLLAEPRENDAAVARAVGILGDEPALGELLRAACRRWFSRVERVDELTADVLGRFDAVVWDVPTTLDDAAARLASVEWQGKSGRPRLVLLANFPLPAEVARARAAGAAAVLAKPVRLAALRAALD